MNEIMKWFTENAVWLVPILILMISEFLPFVPSKSNGVLQALLNVLKKSKWGGGAGAAVLVVLLLGGCATGRTQDPAVTAGKSLLAAKETIIGIRTVAAKPCQDGVLSQDVCQQIGKLYKSSKPAYDAATDAMLVYLTTGDSTQYELQMMALQDLVQRLVILQTQSGIGGAK